MLAAVNWEAVGAISAAYAALIITAYLFDKAEMFYDNIVKIGEAQTRKLRRRLPSTGEVASVADVLRGRKVPPTP